MIARAVSLALTALALLAPATAAASTDPGRWDGAHWHYPSQRLANNPTVDRWVAFTSRLWEGRGVHPKHPTVYLANDLGAGVHGRADAATGDLWLLPDDVAAAQDPHAIDRAFGTVDLAVWIEHEMGHLARMKWGDSLHAPSGIMDPHGDGDDTIEFSASVSRHHRVRYVAYGTGAIGVAVAHEYNVQRQLRLAKRALAFRWSRLP